MSSEGEHPLKTTINKKRENLNEELNLKSNRFIDWAGWVSTNKANIFFKIPEIHPYFENFVLQSFLEKGTLSGLFVMK